MDVYHKVLTKIYEETGGKDSVDIDLTDLTKREGFFPSLDDITKFLTGESWVTETPKRYVVRITHWGVSEAKKALIGAPNKAQLIERDSKRAVSDVRETLVMLEEFAGKPDAKKFEVIRKRFDEAAAALARIEKNL
jgi:hypothetical protein